MIGAGGGEANSHVPRQRHVDHAFGRQQRIIAGGERHLGLEFVGWPRRDQIDRSAGRVASLQRALWAAQQLDPLQIEKRVRHGIGAIDVDPVDIVGDRLIHCRLRRIIAHTADVGEQQESRLELDGGRQRDELRRIGDPARLDRRGVDGGHRQGGALQVFAAL